MKEFHLVLAQASRNPVQFVQLCHDTHWELNNTKRPVLSAMYIFNKYYNANLQLLQLLRLAKFIESGEYKKHLELYV